MKNGTLEMERFATLADTLFTGAKGAKVFDRFGYGVAKETHDNSTRGIGGSLNFDIKVHFTGNSFGITGEYKRKVPKNEFS
jgi:hypothetical protein